MKTVSNKMGGGGGGGGGGGDNKKRTDCWLFLAAAGLWNFEFHKP